MRISFAKWFKVLKEGDSYSDVIVAYEKYPTEWTFIEHPGGKGESVPCRVRRLLFINLWLFRLEFSLETTIWK